MILQRHNKPRKNAHAHMKGVYWPSKFFYFAVVWDSTNVESSGSDKQHPVSLTFACPHTLFF